jgi:hypothetical protein
MKQGRVAKQVEEASRGIFAAEEQIRTLTEQLATWEEMREDLHVRALVSETPQAAAELSGIERQCDIAKAAISEQQVRKSNFELLMEALMIEWKPEVAS